jgi:hypothetical protein
MGEKEWNAAGTVMEIAATATFDWNHIFLVLFLMAFLDVHNN